MKLAIIPARAGSKRIKNKNIVDFCGRPMISYALTCAQDSGLFDKVHVSTDSRDIADLVGRLGFPVDFLRSPDLADDRTHVTPVMQWVIRQYRQAGTEVESVCLLFPCSPLIEPSDLQAAHGSFAAQNGRVPVLAVVPFPFPIQRALSERANGLLAPHFPEFWAARSQDLVPTFHDTGTFGFFGAEHLRRCGETFGDRFIPHVLPRHKVIDIDEPEDLELAEILFRGVRARAAAG